MVSDGFQMRLKAAGCWCPPHQELSWSTGSFLLPLQGPPSAPGSNLPSSPSWLPAAASRFPVVPKRCVLSLLGREIQLDRSVRAGGTDTGTPCCIQHTRTCLYVPCGPVNIQLEQVCLWQWTAWQPHSIPLYSAQAPVLGELMVPVSLCCH